MQGDSFSVYRYVDLILSILVPKGAVLMSSFDYNQEERLIAPFSIPGPLLQQLWGQSCCRKSSLRSCRETIDLL